MAAWFFRVAIFLWCCMKPSVFTPTNNYAYISEAYASLTSQTFSDWEWVVCPNGGLDDKQLPMVIRNDPRVRVVPVPPEVGDNIGALKRFACDRCLGDVFVELDHDDMLVPTCLADVMQLVNQGCGFVYSDAASFVDESGAPTGYTPNWGWELYTLNVYGKQFLATKTFPITARTLCEVYFAPDHVRAWTRDAYYKAGGHDPLLSVGDDHDLVVRTYLARVEFGYTNNCGYLYRNHKTNTVKLRNKKIQETVAITRQKYLRPLIEEWCRRKDYPIVDMHQVLADGFKWDRDLFHGFGPTDIGCLKASNILQFMPQGYAISFFNEVWHSLVPGGWVIIDVPSTDGRAGFQDPRATSFWNRNSFLWYTDQDWRKQAPEVIAKFQAVQLEDYYESDDHKARNMLWTRADLMSLRGQRHPGREL